MCAGEGYAQLWQRIKLELSTWDMDMYRKCPAGTPSSWHAIYAMCDVRVSDKTGPKGKIGSCIAMAAEILKLTFPCKCHSAWRFWAQIRIPRIAELWIAIFKSEIGCNSEKFGSAAKFRNIALCICLWLTWAQTGAKHSPEAISKISTYVLNFRYEN